MVFSCNWGGWSCIDAAVNAGLQYPASVKVLRVSCLARVHAGLILKAFEFGADGVMLLGCEPGSCHFDSDNMCVSKEYEKTQDILDMLGIWGNRLALVQLPAFDGQQFIARLMNFLAEIEQTTAYQGVRTASSKPV